MRTVILLAILLWAWPSGADVVVDPGSVHIGPRILGEPAFVFELDAISQDEVSRPGWPVTTTRASEAMCQQWDGTWVTVPADTACVGRWGLESYPAATNYFTESTDPFGWSVDPATGCSVSGPDADGWYTLTDARSDASCAFYRTNSSPSTGEWTTTFELASGTLSTARIATNSSAGAGGGMCSAVSLASSGGRHYCTRALTSPSYVNAVVYLGSTFSDTGSIRVRQAQLEKSPTPGPRVDCGPVPCSRAADRHAVSTEGWPTDAGRIAWWMQLARPPRSGEPIRIILRNPSGVPTLAVAGNGALAVNAGGGFVFTAPLLAEDTSGHEFAFVYSESRLALMMDGAEVWSSTGAFVVDWGDEVQIGTSGSTNPAPLSGSIRLLRVSEGE